MTVLAARDAYRLWAPTYADETAISFIEDQVVAAMTPSPAGLRLLDAGCGTGRRLRSAGAASAVGIDVSLEMLAAGLAAGAFPGEVKAMVGDVRALPLPDRSFDIIWCRLVVGHLPDCGPAYAELARVCDAGATVIVSDFHPAAWRKGHRRTFRHGDIVEEIEHHVHDLPTHLSAASAAGLELTGLRSGVIGPDVCGFYDTAGRSELYREHEGLPVVLALAFRRRVRCGS